MTVAAAFAALFVALFVGHQLGDFWVQTHHQACTKGNPGWPGRRACLAHVGTYTATQLVLVLIVAVRCDIHLDPLLTTAGLAVSAGTHYLVDRRTPLLRLAEMLQATTGKADFYRLGACRPGRDDNPSLGTGAFALDQSWHIVWCLVAALIMV